MGTAAGDDYYARVQRLLGRLNAEQLRASGALRNNEERVAAVDGVVGAEEALHVEPHFLGKSAVEARGRREQGNAAYARKLYAEALRHYDAAVTAAPWPQPSRSESLVSEAATTASSDYVNIGATAQEDLETNKCSSDAPQDTSWHKDGVGGPEMRSSLDVLNLSRAMRHKGTPPLNNNPASLSVHQPLRETCSLGELWPRVPAPPPPRRAYSLLRDNSVISSDADPCQELVLALGNRSATLFKLGNFSECMSDIDLALSLGFPSHLRYKLFERRGRCLMERRQFEEAVTWFDQVVSSMEQCTLSQKQQLNVLLACQKQISVCEDNFGGRKATLQASSGSGPQWSLSAEPVVFTPSARLPSATEGVEVRYSASRGRYMVTQRALSVGEVVLSEGPYAWVLGAEWWGSRCFQCAALLPAAALPCHNCAAVRYCSEACQVAAWGAHHARECCFLELVRGAGPLAHLALRVVLLTPPAALLHCLVKTRSRRGSTRALFTDARGVFVGGFAGLYNLLTHSAGREPGQLFQLAVLAAFLRNILAAAGHLDAFRPVLEQEGTGRSAEVVVGGVLLRFIQIIMCNGIEVMQLSDGDNLAKTNPESVGLALYPTVSLLNHSCNPLVELLFCDSRVVARAIQPVASGGEVSIDYGFLYYTTPATQRQAQLRAQYFFQCACVACEGAWPLKNALYSGIPWLRCKSCGQRLPRSAAHPESVRCRACHAAHDTIAMYQTLRESSNAADRAVEWARRFAVQAAIPALEAHVELLARSICQPFKEYTMSVSLLKQCYRVLANRAPQLTDRLRQLQAAPGQSDLPPSQLTQQ